MKGTYTIIKSAEDSAKDIVENIGVLLLTENNKVLLRLVDPPLLPKARRTELLRTTARELSKTIEELSLRLDYHAAEARIRELHLRLQNSIRFSEPYKCEFDSPRKYVNALLQKIIGRF